MRAHRFAAVAALVAGLAFLIPVASSDQQDPLAGDWTVAGTNNMGPYSGTAKITKDADGVYEIALSYDYANVAKGPHRDRVFVGTWDGHSLTGERGKSPGIAGRLLGANKVKEGVKVVYTLSADGQKLEAHIYGGDVWPETLTKKVIESGVLQADANRDGKIDASDVDAMKAQTALVTLVPNKNDAVRSPLKLTAQGDVTLAATGAGKVKIVDASGASALGVVLHGAQDLSVIGLAAGDVDVTATDTSSNVIGRARFTVKRERLYLIMFGYEGAEVDYLPGDMGKAKAAFLPKLQQAGYKVVEDGQSYDQTAITKGLGDPNAPDKVVVDWCTTHDDWQAYLERGSARGIMWGSHGFMEPWTGCPDDQLLKFESRVWTCVAGSPSATERKHFMREWKALLDANAYQLEFGIFHSCTTGGLGSYASECWQYCDSGTQERVRAKFGSLPDASKLDTTRSFNFIRSRFNFQQTFNGPSYFGMSDARFNEAVAAMTPGN